MKRIAHVSVGIAFIIVLASFTSVVSGQPTKLIIEKRKSIIHQFIKNSERGLWFPGMLFIIFIILNVISLVSAPRQSFQIALQNSIEDCLNFLYEVIPGLLMLTLLFLIYLYIVFLQLIGYEFVFSYPH